MPCRSTKTTVGASSRPRLAAVSRPPRVETRQRNSRQWSLLNKKHKKASIHNFNIKAPMHPHKWDLTQAIQEQDTTDWPTATATA